MEAGDYQKKERMDLKRKAIPFPDLTNKSVLDVGCDHGYWCRYAVDNGARWVTGLDRGRVVKGRGFVDLVAWNAEQKFPRTDFKKINLGEQFFDFGEYDVVFCMSMYHHAFNLCGSHDAIWFWLWRHCKEIVIWEGPTGTEDKVVQKDLIANLHYMYKKDAIRLAAKKYFHIESESLALHESTREVWMCKKKLFKDYLVGKIQNGSGGASKAFAYAKGRRGEEFFKLTGMNPYPGSLNVLLEKDFNWDFGYYVGDFLDVERRGIELDIAEWKKFRVRIYPVKIKKYGAETPIGGHSYLMRFEKDMDRYKKNFVEVISNCRIRNILTDTKIEIGI